MTPRESPSSLTSRCNCNKKWTTIRPEFVNLGFPGVITKLCVSFFLYSNFKCITADQQLADVRPPLLNVEQRI